MSAGFKGFDSDVDILRGRASRGCRIISDEVARRKSSVVVRQGCESQAGGSSGLGGGAQRWHLQLRLEGFGTGGWATRREMAAGDSSHADRGSNFQPEPRSSNRTHKGTVKSRGLENKGGKVEEKCQQESSNSGIESMKETLDRGYLVVNKDVGNKTFRVDRTETPKRCRTPVSKTRRIEWRLFFCRNAA